MNNSQRPTKHQNSLTQVHRECYLQSIKPPRYLDKLSFFPIRHTHTHTSSHTYSCIPKPFTTKHNFRLIKILYMSSKILREHTHWGCNSNNPKSPGGICDARNNIEVPGCRKCGNKKQPGTKALDDNDKDIGEYVGNEKWRYFKPLPLKARMGSTDSEDGID